MSPTPHPVPHPILRRTHRDAGATLIETLVAIALLSVLTTFIATLAVLVSRSSSQAVVRVDNTSQSELAVASVSKVLRTAILPSQIVDQTCTGCSGTALVSATTSGIVFYANLNNTGQGPSLVTLQVAQDPARPGTGVLNQTVQPPISTGSGTYRFCDPAQTSCAKTTRVVARGLLWPTATVFTYYDYDGLAMTGSPLAGTDLPRGSSVDVVVTAQTATGARRPPSRTTVSRIQLPNEVTALSNATATATATP